MELGENACQTINTSNAATLTNYVSVHFSKQFSRARDAVISGLPASFANEREQVIYEMATALANSRWICKGLYDRAVKVLGHTGITDVTVLMGFYTAVSLTVGFYGM